MVNFKCFPAGCLLLLSVLTHFTFFHQQVSTGHIVIPSSLWLRIKFLLKTAVGLLRAGLEPGLSAFQRWTRTAICLNKLIPAVQLNLWKRHHCDNFRHVWLFKWIFRDVPSCSCCYLSQNKNRIKDAHLLKMAFSPCASCSFKSKWKHVRRWIAGQ